MRVDKVRRFLDVQKQMQRSAEWALHELRHEQHRLQQAQQEMITALSREDPLNMWLAPALMRQLVRLAAEENGVAAAEERQMDIVLEQTGRLRQAERLERALGTEHARAREKIVLSDVIEVVAGTSSGTGTQGFGKHSPAPSPGPRKA
jgi:hypothetical protein